MVKKVLFFSIGNRDLQAVYELRENFFGRCPVNLTNLKAPADELPIYHRHGITELERRDLKTDTEKALCFPMFDKVVEYLQCSKKSEIEYLFILSTDRSEILPKLEELKLAWEMDIDSSGDLYDYLDRGIIKWIKADQSAKTSSFLAECIQSGRLSYEGVSFKKVVILKLGSYGQLKSILDLNVHKKVSQELLELADINTMTFFEREIYKALAPFYADLEDSTILLGTHAGGMPLVHRALDNVLSNTVGFAKYVRIFTSEYLSFKVDKGSAPRFLNYIGQMNQSVINMQWDQASFYLEKLKTTIHDTPQILDYVKLASIIKKGCALWESEGSWFERFTAHIFRALYTDSFNELVVWISSMEQAAKLDLATKQVGKLWKAVHKDREVVELHERVKRELFVKLDVGRLLGYCNETEIKTAFSGYSEVFFDYENGWENDNWKIIRQLRNDLVHKGLAPGRSPSNKDLVYEFIGIEKTALQEARAAVRSRDLSSIIKFETDLLKNRFFSPLGSIVSHSSSPLKERMISQEYFRVLHYPAMKNK